MQTITLGKTGLVVNKNGFGALPIQRVNDEVAVQILRKAYDNGINYFDTARYYSDSEHKIGLALKDVRSQIYIATKTMAQTAEQFWIDLHASLADLQTDYIDVHQFHNPPFCPKPGDGTGLYEAMLEAKEKGMIRHIAITNHQLAIAEEAIESGLYELLQFPFSYLSTEKELALVKACHEKNIAFVSMKALSGGLIQDSAAAYAFQNEYPVLPIWGIQKESELDEFLSYQEQAPSMTPDILAVIEADRNEIMGDFCRGCGYCLPCPVKINIPWCARMSLLLRRGVTKSMLTEHWQGEMKRIEECIHCNQCSKKCPYELNTPKLLEDNFADYQEVLAGKSI